MLCSEGQQANEASYLTSASHKGRRVGGCGRSHCLVCHYDKLFGYPSRQEACANECAREVMQELELSGFRKRQRLRTR